MPNKMKGFIDLCYSWPHLSRWQRIKIKWAFLKQHFRRTNIAAIACGLSASMAAIVLIDNKLVAFAVAPMAFFYSVHLGGFLNQILFR